MASIAGQSRRHGVLDDRPGHYLCFPDLLDAGGGLLVAAYREADRHVATRRRLLVRQSLDGGKTWGAPVVATDGRGHCPRLSLTGPGRLAMADDNGALYESGDGGRTWAATMGTGMRHGVTDRILVLDDGTWLTTAHRHLDLDPDPATGQRPTEQVVFASSDGGRSWERRAVLAGPGRLVLCEAAMTALPDGRLLALLRENSQVGEPVYRAESADGGRTWSAPRPTPIVGHRPTPGLTRDGRLLITFRDVGPAGGTAAWLGPVENLEGFAVQGSRSHAALGLRPKCGPDGLLLDSTGGPPPLYLLRPLTDPEIEHAALEAEVRCLEGAQALRLGGWWLVRPDRLEFLAPPEDDGPQTAEGPVLAEIPLDPGRFSTIRIQWRPGEVAALVDGELRATVPLPAADVRRRPVLFGCAPFGPGGRGLWRTVRQAPRRAHGPWDWGWNCADGAPDERAAREILQLADPTRAAWCDTGYTGWAETAPGRFVCAYHHATGDEPEYAPGTCAHVRTTWFTSADFGPAAP